MRFGTVSTIGATWKIVDDIDATTEMPVDVWMPLTLAQVGNRVLYEVVAGKIVVVYNVDNPARTWGTTLTMGGTANVGDNQAITFPTGLFPTAPRVEGTLGTGNSAPATINTEIWASAITASGFTANFIRNNATACTVRWVAILG